MTEADLKALFRRWARKTHPDTAGTSGEANGEAFVRLKSEYDEALASRHREAPQVPAAEPELIDLFCALVAQGFPAPSPAARASPLYQSRLGALGRAYQTLPGVGPGEGQTALDALTGLRGPGLVASRDFSLVMGVFYAVVSARTNPFPLTLAALARDRVAAVKMLEAKGWKAAARFTDTVADLVLDHPRGG